MNTQSVIDEVLQELDRAHLKHPTWPHNLFHRMAILTEEIGELNQAAVQHVDDGAPQDRIRKEAIQVATVAIRLIMSLPDPSGSAQNDRIAP